MATDRSITRFPKENTKRGRALRIFIEMYEKYRVDPNRVSVMVFRRQFLDTIKDQLEIREEAAVGHYHFITTDYLRIDIKGQLVPAATCIDQWAAEIKPRILDEPEQTRLFKAYKQVCIVDTSMAPVQVVAPAPVAIPSLAPAAMSVSAMLDGLKVNQQQLWSDLKKIFDTTTGTETPEEQIAAIERVFEHSTELLKSLRAYAVVSRVNAM